MLVPSKISLDSPLRFPGVDAARRPGVDGNHPASSGLLLSSISALAGNHVRIDRTSIGSLSNAPTFAMDGVLGPTMQTGTTNNAGNKKTSFTITTPAGGNLTMGAIVRPIAVSGGTAATIMLGITAANGTGLIQANGGNAQLRMGGALTTLTGLTFAAGMPYGFFVSVRSAVIINAVLVNLSTGQIQSFTAATALSNNASTVIHVGNNNTPNSNFGGNVAAVMYSTALLSLNKLLMWASDPWAFWYPRPNVFDMIRTPVAAAAVSNWIFHVFP